MRILLSYNEADAWLINALRASLFLSSPDLDVLLSPPPCVAPLIDLSKPVDFRQFHGLLLVAGPSGLTVRQQTEWTAGTRRAEQDDKFVLLPVLAGRSAPPSAKGLENRAWFRAPVVTDRNMICSLVQALETSRS